MAPSTTIRRLLKEVAELSPDTSNPNPAFYAAPVSDSNLHEWHFTLLGPPSPSSYAGGVYHGRISLPSQYPLKPPNFRFLTPSGRFEVNREICLSISGFHEETWMPAWGVRTALTALRTFMSEAGTAGQVGGLEATDETRKRLASESRTWKCYECSKTNNNIMEEWWSICREKGVKVDEEGMGLESLPDGMSVEAIDRSKGKANEGEQVDARSQAENLHQHGQPDDRSSLVPESKSSLTTEGSGQNPIQTSESNPYNREPSISHSTVAGSTPQTHLTPTPTVPGPPSPDLNRSHQDPSTAPPPPTPSHLPQPHPRQQPQQGPAISLDRAITVVFLALCIMVIKKLFYSSSTPSGYNGGGGGGGSSDDWEIGLSREY